MTKALSKSIMDQTHLRNTFLKNPTVPNKLVYTKQRNFYVSLLRKVKWEYFANLSEKNITDNMNLWQTGKPFLSEKNKSREKIAFAKNEEIISEDVEVENTLNSYFSNVAKNFKIPEIIVTDSLLQSLSRHQTLNSIHKYKNHPGMHVSERFSQCFSSFYFSHVGTYAVL